MAPTTPAPPPSAGPPTPTPSSVRVSPLVLLAAADAYTRRPDGAGRVVGTLLGVASPETGLVDVRDCFVVPHSEANDTV
jgi:translation initiation factor 3 subunit F